MKLKSSVTKILTNKWVLNIIAVIALFNVIGYMVMGNFNNVVFFIVLAFLVRYFSKNMIIVLGVPLIFVNLFSFKNSSYRVEGLEMNKTEHNKNIKKINDDKEKKNSHIIHPNEPDKSDKENDLDNDNIESSNIKTDETFEVGRVKKGGSKIDYSTTIENAYDELNKILGSDGIKNLTDDTQRLMKQQMQLAESMQSLSPIVEKMMPIAEKMQGMMKTMDSSGDGMKGIMDMAKNMAGKLGSATPN
jgi:hypothetical protein